MAIGVDVLFSVGEGDWVAVDVRVAATVEVGELVSVGVEMEVDVLVCVGETTGVIFPLPGLVDGVRRGKLPPFPAIAVAVGTGNAGGAAVYAGGRGGLTVGTGD